MEARKMRKTSLAQALVIGLALVAGPVLAQPASPAPEAQAAPAPQGMARMPMGQMMQSQGGMMMGRPMTQRMASLDGRLRRLEERAGVPAPQPSAQPSPGTR
jgi:hypothetical protein